MKRDPAFRFSPAIQTVMALVMLGAWGVIMTYDPVGKARVTGIAGFVVTLAALAVMIRAFVQRREPGGVVVILSLLSLVLLIAAMKILFL